MCKHLYFRTTFKGAFGKIKCHLDLFDIFCQQTNYIFRSRKYSIFQVTVAKSHQNQIIHLRNFCGSETLRRVFRTILIFCTGFITLSLTNANHVARIVHERTNN